MKTKIVNLGGAAADLPEIRKKHRNQRLRRKIVIPALLVAAVIGIVWALLDNSEKQSDLSLHPQWQPTFLKGQVTALGPDGTTLPLDIGTPLAPGTRISSGPKSEIDLAAPGIGVLKLDKDSEVIIGAPEQSPDTDAATLELKKGRIFHKLPKLEPGKELRLQTAGIQLVVRGTEFFVEANGEDTIVAVRSGTVEVTLDQPGGEWIRDVYAGEMASLNPDTGGKKKEIGARERGLFRNLDRIIDFAGASGDQQTEQWITLLPSDASDMGSWTFKKNDGVPDPEVSEGKLIIRTNGKQTVAIRHPVEPVNDLVFKFQYQWRPTNEAVAISLETTNGNIRGPYLRNGGWWGFNGKDLKPRINLTTGYNPASLRGTGIDKDGFVTLTVAKLGRSLAFYAGGEPVMEAPLEKDIVITDVNIYFSQFHDGSGSTELRNMQVYYPDSSMGPNGERQEVDYWRCARAIGNAEDHEARLAALRQTLMAPHSRLDLLLRIAMDFEEAGEAGLAAYIYQVLCKTDPDGRRRQESRIKIIARARLGTILKGQLAMADNSESPPSILVARGSAWKHLGFGNSIPLNWNSPQLDDSTWPEGPAVLGFGKKTGISTELNFGDDPKNKNISYYFRQTFDCDDVGSIRNLVVSLGRGNPSVGAVLYLNGKEIDRCNMQPGLVLDHTKSVRAASVDKEEGLTLLLPSDELAKGRNVIAVSMHLPSPSHSRLGFDLSLRGIGEVFEIQREEIGLDEEAWGQ